MVKPAFITKYLSPTGTRGARIKATSELGNVTIPYDHSASMAGAHFKAAQALCRKLKFWPCKLLQGSVRKGYAFVFEDSQPD